MQIRSVTALAVASVLGLASPGLSLEKRALPYDASDTDGWSSGATCLISYYNICTGWVWVLGVNDPDVESETVQLGVHVIGSPKSTLVQSRIRYWTGSPQGRGFTGTISMYAADANGCPAGPALETQPFLAPFVAGNAFYTHNWGGAPLPNPFVIAVTYPADVNGTTNPIGFGADFGTTGPTGPDACGTCYPTGRLSHSYLWKDSGGTYCPGENFMTVAAPNCEVELLWDLTLHCPVSVDDATWGSIKGLYR